LIALHRAGHIALGETHIAESEEGAAHDVGRRARCGRAPEPPFRVGGVALLEGNLAFDQRAEPEAFARLLDDRRRPIPADDTLKDAHRRAAVADPDQRHSEHEQ